METAVGAANWLLGKVLHKLSDDLVAGYVASCELGLNYDKITDELNHTLGLLHAAQGRDVGDNPGLQRLLEGLSKKADEAEDALDELHYFMIQDELDGTREATPELGDGLGAQALHAGHAARNTAGNWLSYFSCFRSQDHVASAVTNETHNRSKAKSDIGTDSGNRDDKLSFDRVAMSNKIKQLLEDMHSKCSLISDLLKINPSSSLQPSMPTPTKRPYTSSEITQKKLFGRDAIFGKTMSEMINVKQNGEILSVLPILGPGGIGKTTFTQHLYNDKRTEKHFTVKVWICVSINFEVLKLSQEILGCLLATENEGNKTANHSSNLDLLQKSIAERIKSKRFLIVLDDIWECKSNDEWEKLLAPFKKGETTGNMVLVTTRFPKIAEMVTKATNPIDLHGLDPDEFWRFFQVCAFGEILEEHHDKEDLIDIGRQIACKLKSSPLAAKTVGQLLSKKPCREHWVEVLENKEWLNEKHDDDIIPALKISYDYLPFHLKECFSFCSLFPEDYKFNSQEISRFWISVGITDSSCQNVKIEDIGSKYLDELLDNGFMMKGDDNYYVMHDLMHELSKIVSSKECAYINCSSFKANDIISSIRHLSILMQNKYIDNFGEEMDKLRRRIDIGNLRSLMIFGEYRRASLVNILKDTFNDIKGLRVLFIFMYSLDSLPHNFSKLIHLRYLKLKSPGYSEVCLPSTVSRFYHLKFLDLQNWESNHDLPKGISRLVNLCHFAVDNKELHSNISEVGKMKLLQELRRFHVKKESVGFELRELGQLEELRGELTLCGLQNVRTREEADEAKLKAKRNLVMLELVWDVDQQFNRDDILNNLQPHSNLRELRIINYGGLTGPSWLSSTLHIKNLETLHLEGVSWGTFLPIGQIYYLRKLKLKNIVGICQFGPDFIGGITERSFKHLKEVELDDMPELVEWVEGANSHLLSSLERVSCNNCPKLTALPSSGWSSSSAQDNNNNTISFPNLCNLYIKACPKLHLPPIPHTSKLSSFQTDHFHYRRTKLHIELPSELVIRNLGKVEDLVINDPSLISSADLQKLHPLRSIEIMRCDGTFLKGLGDDVMLHSVQSLTLREFPLTRESVSSLFICFPALSHLDVRTSSDEDCDKEIVLQFPASSSLRNIKFNGCSNLILPAEDGSGFQGLPSLESVEIGNHGSGRLFTRWLESVPQTQSIGPFPFPCCLKKLSFWNVQSPMSMALLSNLTSLTNLKLRSCKNVMMDGFNPLIASNLIDLEVYNSRNGGTETYSVAAMLLAEVARMKAMSIGSFQLVHLQVDSVPSVLVAPICSRLTATLRFLLFWHDCRVDSFTEEQEQALQLLMSLKFLGFEGCMGLQSLPEGLHRHSSLEVLLVSGSPKIGSLPKKGLPDSLQRLDVMDCCTKVYDECQKLRGTRPDIQVYAEVYC